MKTFYW